jgi:alpha-beta hydrolase superfamily lysophospholipase
MTERVSESVLDVTAPRGTVTAVALVLHGGRETSTSPVRARHLAVVRMRPFADAIERSGRADGVAVARLRHAVRGWNGDLRSPVGDAVEALDRISAAYPGAPVALVGHSMGGRTALHVAGHPAVTTVVGLAPWIEADDPVDTVRGRHLFIAHGTRDRTTSPKASAAFVQRAQDSAASATFVAVHREGHPLLRRATLWHDLAAGYVLARLCGVPLERSAGPQAAEVVRAALAGKTRLDV